MSNSLAIAAATATLRNLLTAIQTDIPGTLITVAPMGSARSGTTNQLNIYLYNVERNTGWSNQPYSDNQATASGEPPIAIDLLFLVTAYGNNDDEVHAHQVLGRAMSLLHDQPVLNRTAIASALTGNDLHEQIESVRITQESLTLDDLSRLWSAANTEIRLSVAYRANVVLIESARPTPSPLPVLTSGIEVAASLNPVLPTITQLVLPNNAPSVRLGEVIRVEGFHLENTVEARFETERSTSLLTLAIGAATATHIDINLPNDAPAQQDWFAGSYRLVLRMADDRETNVAAFILAPRITGFTPNPTAGATQLDVSTEPEVRVSQNVRLFLGSQGIDLASAAGSQLNFDLQGVSVGDYLLRLRVDGVDSHAIDYSASPLQYDSAAQVQVS